MAETRIGGKQVKLTDRMIRDRREAARRTKLERLERLYARVRDAEAQGNYTEADRLIANAQKEGGK